MIEVYRDRIRVGVAGAGMMGAIHIRLLAELNGIYELVGVYDPDQERAAIAEKYGARSYSSYEELLNDVDMVTLACPTSLHKPMALQAAENDVHVLTEKPIAESLADAQEMYNAFKEKNLKFMVSHVERFNPVVRTISDIIKGKEIIAVEMHRCSPFDSRIYDVDVVSDLMIHDMDIVLNSIFKTSPKSVSAVGAKVYGNKFVDYAQATLMFPDKSFAFITSSRCTEEKIRTVCIHTNGAYIEGDMLRRTLTVKRGVNYEEESTNPRINYTQSNVTEQIVLMDQNPLKEEIASFGKSILNWTDPFITEDEVIRSMEILDIVKRDLYQEDRK